MRIRRRGRKRSINLNNLSLFIIMSTLLIASCFISFEYFFKDNQLTQPNVSVSSSQLDIISEIIPPQEPDEIFPPKGSFEPSSPISSKSVLLIDLSDSSTIYALNENEKVYPASLTKIMTILTALAQADLADEITVKHEDFKGLFEQNASLAGFAVDETVTIKDILYAVMLPSGAEASVALTRTLAGNEENFVKLMNQKAQTLGLNNTKFVNSSGLHHPDHYTTAKDMAILLKTALENETFKKIYTTYEYTCTPTTEHPDGLKLRSTLKRQQDIFGIDISYFSGAKTGYTDEAGACLSSIHEKNSQYLMMITFGVDSVDNKPPMSIDDSISIYKEYLQQ